MLIIIVLLVLSVARVYVRSKLNISGLSDWSYYNNRDQT